MKKIINKPSYLNFAFILFCLGALAEVRDIAEPTTSILHYSDGGSPSRPSLLRRVHIEVLQEPLHCFLQISQKKNLSIIFPCRKSPNLLGGDATGSS
ncbi:hypothetical protein CIPAW_09G039900 [Carya illinoinensis]|uniref:Secreted protein n=1 Tax=Carya illinoinensis TaxID=32201 RepID=A0A8T1PKD4_CARIL|nr:hypothetical protein CIPAW_09G039900 [Carya illinoinensis]